MARFLCAACAVAVLVGICVGQSSDRLEVFGGYSHVNSDFSLTSPHGLNGWNASATLKAWRYGGVVGDFAGYYPSYSFGCGTACSQSAKIHTFLFGPQISFTTGRIKPFVRFLIGDTHVSVSFPGTSISSPFTSNNSLTLGAGGGVDVRLIWRLAIRGQVDWLHTRFQTSDNQLSSRVVPNVARISTGVVLRF